jgi:hypothetical protein
MGSTRRVEPKGNRRAIRPIRINAALLAVALAPLIFGLCSNIVTGGSFAAALQERNLWVYPFLVASGIIYIISNYKEAEKATSDPSQVSPEKIGENIAGALPSAVKAVKRALVSVPDSFGQDDEPGDQRQGTAFDEPPETLQGLIGDLFASTVGQFTTATVAAAWRLAGLMDSSNVHTALERLELTEDQLRQPRLKWLVRPGEGSTQPNDPLNVVQGRIGYLIGEGGLKYQTPLPLAVDPFIAVALIAVRENTIPYHSECLVNPHNTDADIINELYHAGRSGENPPTNYLGELEYRDLGRLIRLDLMHTNPQLGARQAKLISHVMRHFLDDDLSAVLFDALSQANQARLAVAMLTASQWMSPADWRYWARTGHDLMYAPKLEAARDLSFAGAAGLAIGIVAMGCWQIVAWISYGWSWYFGSSHFLVASPGWLKAFLIIVAIVVCTVWLVRVVPLGIAVAVAGGIGLVMSILASPVVRVHSWIGSWGTSSTIVICGIISIALLAWVGIFYSDRRYAEQPVQLGGVASGRSSRIVARSRFRPDHEVGHREWCAIPSLFHCENFNRSLQLPKLRYSSRARYTWSGRLRRCNKSLSSNDQSANLMIGAQAVHSRRGCTVTIIGMTGRYSRPWAYTDRPVLCGLLVERRSLVAR